MHKKKDVKFGERLRSLRKKAGLTQVDVANSISISPGSYQRYEYGASPSRKNLNEIIEFFRCSKIWLLHGTGDPHPIDEEFQDYSFVLGKTGIDTYNKVETFEDKPEIIELLKMASWVLKSRTEYANSLAANIRSFNNSVKNEKELDEIKNRQAKSENIIADLQKEIELLKRKHAVRE